MLPQDADFVSWAESNAQELACMTDEEIIALHAKHRQQTNLSALLAVAKAEHEAGLQAETAALEHYRKAGEALAQAKKLED